MPYSWSSKPAAERTKVWEGEEGCTIISPEELSYRPPPSPSPTPNLTRTTSTSLCEEQEVGVEVEVAVVLPQPEVLATTRPRVVVNSPTVLPSSRVNSRLNNRDHRQHQFPAGSDNNSTLGDEAAEGNHLHHHHHHHHHHNHNRSSGNQEALGGNGGMDGGGGEHHQNHHQYQHQQHHHHHHQQQQQQHPHRRASAAESGGASHHHKTPRMDGYDSYNSNQLHDRGGQRLLVVANRLPVSAIWDGQKWDLKLSAGGLVSALLGVKQNFETRWIGWAGVSVPDKDKDKLIDSLASKGCVPVFLEDDIADQYYNGYCNNVLWPLFHYIGLPQEDRLAATRSMDSQFSAYEAANEAFAEVVLKQYQEGDVVWCHDYHLMCLPKYLKTKNPHMKVGWFLHTPFPSSEIFRTLPLRSELLKAVLTADLIGFHTYDYARHFVSACTRILGLEGTPEGVEDQGKLTRVAAFPIGIDPERFIQALETEPVKLHIEELRKFFNGRKVMLGVDRLDMIKGIPQKLLAFEMFLEKNPEWREKVMLVQIAVPTRTDVQEYQRLTSQVHEIVGRINGRYGSVTFVPIHHLDRSLAFHELCALYASTDVALVTSLRDGMNLVSYEYVACQNSKAKQGVLVLSEFAGAAQSLGAGAILVNPWNITAMHVAIKEALEMPDNARNEYHRHNFQHVTNHTAQHWADTFVSELNDTIVEAELRTLKSPPDLPVEDAVQRFRNSKRRLIVMGFNATVTGPVEKKPDQRADQVREMKLGLHTDIKEPLKTLCAEENTDVVILSGSERSVLDEVFGDYNVWLAAENGMFLRHTRFGWIRTMEHLNMDWRESVQLVFDYFRQRTPQSYIEVRDTALVWNYKYADVEFGRVQARNMLQHLWTGPISNAAVDVVQGSKSVEVRPIGVSKGGALDRIINEIRSTKDAGYKIDYVLVIGHFLSKDEDVYAYFDPDIALEREHPYNNGGIGGGLDRRLSAKSCDRILAKSNKHGVVRNNKPNRVISPDRNGTHSRSSSGSYSSYLRSNSSSNSILNSNFKEDGSFGAEDNKDDDKEEQSGTFVTVNRETFFSCAVGRARSAARFSLASSEEVVSFVKALADPKNIDLGTSDEEISSVSLSLENHTFQFSGERKSFIPRPCDVEPRLGI